MTQTIDQRARELVKKHCRPAECYADVADAEGEDFFKESEVVAALTEALTREAEAVAKIGDRDDTIRNLLNERKAYEARIEALEAERNAGGFVGINSVMNEKLRDANETICEQRTRIEELEGALKHIQSGITRKVATPFISHGQPSKQDRCQHGQYMYEDCEACIDVFIDEVLSKPTLTQGIKE